jgi:hypothetical protein
MGSPRPKEKIGHHVTRTLTLAFTLDLKVMSKLFRDHILHQTKIISRGWALTLAFALDIKKYSTLEWIDSLGALRFKETSHAGQEKPPNPIPCPHIGVRNLVNGPVRNLCFGESISLFCDNSTPIYGEALNGSL